MDQGSWISLRRRLQFIYGAVLLSRGLQLQTERHSQLHDSSYSQRLRFVLKWISIDLQLHSHLEYPFPDYLQSYKSFRQLDRRIETESVSQRIRTTPFEVFQTIFVLIFHLSFENTIPI